MSVGIGNSTMMSMSSLASNMTIDSLLAGEPATVMVALFTLFVCVSVGAAVRTLSRRKRNVALNPDEFQAFELCKKEIVSHDTRRFTFALQTPDTKLGLTIGQHITLRFVDRDGKGCQRSYTPITGDEVLGQVTFMIKVYKAGIHPKFPEGGKMSQHLDSLRIGDTIDMKGPRGHMTYLGRGKFTLELMRKPLQARRATHFGMIAGGTGITPMLQVVSSILREGGDSNVKTISLLYANQTEDDILVREELEAIARDHPGRFKLHYTVDSAPTDGEWKYSVGFINKDMIKDHMPPSDSNHRTQILMCGPPPMIKFACLPNLEALGYTEDDWFVF